MLSITGRWIIIMTDRKTILVILHKMEPPKLLFAPDRQLKKYKKGYQQVNLPHMPGRYDEQLIELARIINGQKESEYPPEHDLAVQDAVLKAGGAPLN